MNCSAERLRASSSVRRTVSRISLAGRRTGIGPVVAGHLRPKLVPNFAALFPNVAGRVQIHQLGALRTRQDLISERDF
jgi:hypothetical protein